MKKQIIIPVLILIAGIFTSCSNDEQNFDDFDYSTVYFSYQTPIRTIILGEDIYDTTLDNEYKCQIMATMGGVYENKNDVTIDISVDNSIVDNITFSDASDIKVMPDSYYSLNDDKIIIPKGNLWGGVEVQLTDAFFADTASTHTTYVIPVRMLNVTNADSILRGKSDYDDPNLFTSSDWIVEPKDYTLYAIKYINKYTGHYLRRGVDNITGDTGNTDLDTSYIYHAEFVEKDEVVETSTKSLKIINLPITVTNKIGEQNIYTLKIMFDDDDNCTITAPDEASYSISGNGKYVVDGDSWGNEPKDALYLNYNIDNGSVTHACTDTLVIRDRGVSFETFDAILKEQ